MAGISESYATMTITATSADGNLRGRLVGATTFSFRVRSGAFDRYRQGSAELQAAALISRMCAEVKTGSQQILEKHGVEVVAPERLAEPERRRFHAALDGLSVTGMSSSKLIRVSIVGTQATVRIKPGAWEGMTEQTFVAELGSAATMMRHARKQRTMELKDEHFSLGSTVSLNPFYRD